MNLSLWYSVTASGESIFKSLSWKHVEVKGRRSDRGNVLNEEGEEVGEDQSDESNDKHKLAIKCWSIWN